MPKLGEDGGSTGRVRGTRGLVAVAILAIGGGGAGYAAGSSLKEDVHATGLAPADVKKTQDRPAPVTLTLRAIATMPSLRSRPRSSRQTVVKAVESATSVAPSTTVSVSPVTSPVHQAPKQPNKPSSKSEPVHHESGGGT